MGTRHLIEVKLDGELKVAQYGQWDGYYTGQGEGIADFIHNDMDKDNFKQSLRNCQFMTKERIEEIDHPNKWQETHPWLSRDLGSQILSQVQDNDGLELIDSSDFKDDGLMCEFYYLIDMDNETVTVNGVIALPFSEWTKEKMDELEKAANEDED
jgi:hypothetical protein